MSNKEFDNTPFENLTPEQVKALDSYQWYKYYLWLSAQVAKDVKRKRQ